MGVHQTTTYARTYLILVNVETQSQLGGTCHVPRPKVVTGMSSRNHLKKESSAFSAPAAVELDCRPKVMNLPGNSQQEKHDGGVRQELFLTCIQHRQAIDPIHSQI